MAKTRRSNAMTAQGNIIEGIKVADIQISTTYPIVSAWEFEFLKQEAVIRERLDACTIYLIVQRPLTYFDQVKLIDSTLHFEIADGDTPPLRCQLDLVAANIIGDHEVFDIEMQFFGAKPVNQQPFREVGAIRVFKADGSFVVWWSPHKILYEMVVNGLPVQVADDGDPLSFLDFKVHYIGKAFSQKVWERLTGHDKMQRILTLQGPVGASPQARAPFEISLLLLTVVGLSDAQEIPAHGYSIPRGVKAIRHEIDLENDDALEQFLSKPFVELGDEALTNEVEAMLIHHFQPMENQIKFKHYPKIKGGMRSKGYSATSLTVERLPALLYTDHHRVEPHV